MLGKQPDKCVRSTLLFLSAMEDWVAPGSVGRKAQQAVSRRMRCRAQAYAQVAEPCFKENVLPRSGLHACSDGIVCQLDAVQLHTEALWRCSKVPAALACMGSGPCQR